MPPVPKDHRPQQEDASGKCPVEALPAKPAGAAVWRLLPILLLILAGMSGGEAKGSETRQEQVPAGQTRIANPASVQCIRQGGALQIVKREDGGEYGICNFAGGRQCEEWALFRGECPAGGVTVAGDATPAARYCAITGGFYKAAAGGADRGQGRCTFPNGASCDAEQYARGACTPSR